MFWNKLTIVGYLFKLGYYGSTLMWLKNKQELN